MGATHEPWLVALSLVLAFQGSYVGLHMARGISGLRGTARRRSIAMSALSLALAIWTMHFVGMLAVRLPVAVDFLVLPTLISFLVCVLVVGVAIVAVSAGEPTRERLSFAALFMGAGIVTMHYLGMEALHSGLHMTHDPAFVAASALVGVCASGAALWFGFGRGARSAVTAAAVVMALAISAMHYIAMAGLTLHVQGAIPSGLPALSQGLLAVVVSVVAFVVSGLFLLTLVPENGESAGAAVPPAPPDVVAADRSAVPEPAGGVAIGPAARTLPVEKDGLRLHLDVDRLVAVQAQGHYTTLFDGETQWFCPLAISEVEKALDPRRFARIHRSHIVDLDRIAALRRSGDAGLVALATRVPYRAPVARSRRGWLKERLEARLGAAE